MDKEKGKSKKRTLALGHSTLFPFSLLLFTYSCLLHQHIL